MYRSLVCSLCCGVLVLCLSVVCPAQYYQYYRGGGTYPLTADDTLITLRIAEPYSDLVPQDMVNLVSQLGLSDLAEPIASDFYRYRVSDVTDLEDFLDNLRQLPQIEFANPCFTTATGDVVCMSDEIIVSYRPEWSTAQVDSINAARGLSFVLPRDSISSDVSNGRSPSCHGRDLIIVQTGRESRETRTNVRATPPRSETGLFQHTPSQCHTQ
ncbi:MAG TPA: hypothetical protein VM118_00285 [Acidobacteriota bacterium]|nr:hypothetical protein [Acidobacteriota bacterium]